MSRQSTCKAYRISSRFNNARSTNFDGQPPVCRPPLLETRPPFLLGVPSNMQNQQIIYQQQNSQVQPFQHYSTNGPLPPGPTHFLDNRPQLNPNQFQGQVGGPRVIGPRIDYGPRGGLAGPGPGPGPSYNHPPNQPPYVQIQPGPFQNSGVLMQDNQPRLMQNNQGPVLQGNAGGSLLGNLNSVVPPGTSAPLLQAGNQPLPMQGFPRQTSSQGPPLINHPNVQIPNQSPFENRPPFQEPPFENRPVYDSRSGYSDQVPTSQFNTNTLPVPQQSTSNVPNVPLPPGHKILINPHFRGSVQSTNDGKCFKNFYAEKHLIRCSFHSRYSLVNCEQQDSYGIPLSNSNNHLCRHKFLVVSFPNLLSLIRIKVRIIKLSKARRITNKIINKIRAM